MKKALHNFGVIAICICVLAGCGANLSRKQQPRAIKGVLDLSNWNFEKDGPIALSGEYEFYWQQHVRPESFMAKNPPEADGFINVPGSWNGYELSGKKLGGEGYATYRLRVRLHEAAPLALKFLNMGTALTAYANAQELFSAGVPGKTAESTVPHYRPAVVDFAPQTNELELILHFANFHHRKAGAWETIQLGLAKDIHKLREQALLLDLFLLGSILIMGLYHLGLFMARKKEAASLYFGLFCLIIALRLVATVEIFLLYIFPAMGWELLLKLEYLSFYLATPTFTMFLYSLFKEDFPAPLLRVIQVTSILFSSLVLFTPAKVFSYSIIPYQVFTVSSCLCGAYLLLRWTFLKREGAAIILAGFVILFVTIANDILDYNDLIQTARIVPFGLFLFIFSQALLLSFRFSRAFQTSDLQRQELEKINLKYEHELAKRTSAEIALRHSEERYRALYENNPSMYFTVDEAGKILSVNRFGAEQLGYTVEELVGRSVLEVFHPEDQAEVLRQAQKCLQNPNQVFHWEFRKVRKTGELLRVKEHAHAVHDAEGNGVLLVVCEDITEHKRMELALHESEKLAAAGRMAARVAHEINNPLGGIQTAFRLVSSAVPKEHRYYHYVGKIEKEIQRIAKIVRHMLDLHKPGHADLNEFRVSEALQDVVALLKTDARNDKAQIVFDVQNATTRVKLPENTLRQIMYNLILNAIEASPPHGVVRVAAIVAENCLHVTVSDQGPGIPEAIHTRIFEPFFTTKRFSDKSGLGFGLTICKSLVESMNGTLELTSRFGEGAVFKISLPINASTSG